MADELNLLDRGRRGDQAMVQLRARGRRKGGIYAGRRAGRGGRGLIGHGAAPSSKGSLVDEVESPFHGSEQAGRLIMSVNAGVDVIEEP